MFCNLGARSPPVNIGKHDLLFFEENKQKQCQIKFSESVAKFAFCRPESNQSHQSVQPATPGHRSLNYNIYHINAI